MIEGRPDARGRRVGAAPSVFSARQSASEY